ncbi:MAG: formiminoglutamase [Motiliproteus sp.]|jgi:formiminoglutamase
MHEPADMSLWTGRIDSEEPAELSYRLHQLIQPTCDQKSVMVLDQNTALALIGFCSDEGVRRNQGRVGARHGPDRLRRALANLPWPADLPITDAGNVTCQGHDLEQAQRELAEQVSRRLSAGQLPFVLGGGHEMAYGSWLGLVNHLQQIQKQEQKQAQAQAPRIGIINFDAHFDLRLDREGASSGTPFYQIAQQCEQRGLAFNYCCLGVSAMANTQALFRRADSLGVSYRRDTEMAIDQLAATRQQLQRFIDACDVIYLSIDLDVLPASIAPGVSAPAPRGVGLDVLEPLLQQICDSGKLRLADIAEYNPEFDIDNWTARVATRLFHLIANGAINR